MNQFKAGQQRGGHRVDRPVSIPQICFFRSEDGFVYFFNKADRAGKKWREIQNITYFLKHEKVYGKCDFLSEI